MRPHLEFVDLRPQTTRLFHAPWTSGPYGHQLL